tara:strand:- start:896 stop:2206 length:1311 start_codon:yes stop_codon:yes gene_type:complete
MVPEIRILLIEDSSEKAQHVRKLLSKKLEPFKVTFQTSSSYEEARDALNSAHFDIAIVDLMIPVLRGEPSLDASRILIDDMLSGRLNSPPYVLGLTAHKDKAEEVRLYFDDLLLDLLIYHEVETLWADKIASKIRYLVNASRNMNAFLATNFDTDILIICARYQSEFRPIDKKISWQGPYKTNHELFPSMSIKRGTAKFGKDDYRLTTLVSLNEMGIAAAAAMTSQLCLVLKPRMVAMLGMCCGFQSGSNSCALGDVIIVDECACWDEGKYDESYFGTEPGFRVRGKTIQASEIIVGDARKMCETSSSELGKKLASSASWKKISADPNIGGRFGEVPKIRTGKLLSGLSVISDSNKVKTILGRAPSAIGLDMETFGVYCAVRSLGALRPNFISIKGVADFGVEKGEDETTNFDKAQPIASANAYLVFRELLLSSNR